MQKVTQNMQEAIKKILDNIPPKHIFDSHFVINQLIKNHSDIYLQYANKFTDTNKITLSMHGQIGQIIDRFNSIEQLEDKSWSENIHSNASECTCWRKLK